MCPDASKRTNFESKTINVNETKTEVIGCHIVNVHLKLFDSLRKSEGSSFRLDRLELNEFCLKLMKHRENGSEIVISYLKILERMVMG